MKETLVIQLDKFDELQLASFVDGVCEQVCIVNEYGIVSMAVFQAVNVASEQMEQSGELTLEAGNYGGGLYVELRNKKISFNFNNDISTDGVGDRRLYIMNSLVDCIRLSEDNCKVRLEFLLQGIESPFARRRQNVLKNFFALHTVEI